MSGDLEEAKGAADRIREDYDRLSAEMGQLEEKLTKSRELLNQENLKKGSLEGQINVLNEQINTEKMNVEHLKNRMAAIGEEMGRRQEKLLEYGGEAKSLSAKTDEISESQRRAEDALKEADFLIQSIEQRIEEGKSQIIDTLNERASVTARRQRYETMLEQVNVRRSEISQKLLKIKSDESVQEEQLKKEQEKSLALKKRLEAILREQGEQEKGIEQAEAEIRRISRNLNEKHQAYQSAYSRLESLKNIAERYEGYGNSIRRVMDVKDRIRGIHGVVADLITTEKEYETAIETALGGSIQNVVTDSEETAKRLIEYLKKNRYGRATFLPLTSVKMKGGFNQDGILREPGVVGLAHQLVHTDSLYQELIRYLLGRVVVADNIDHAIALARKYQHSLRIVTLEGELLAPGGSMTGGAFKNNSNLLGRKREIEELEQACEKTQKASESLEKELDQAERTLAGIRKAAERTREEKEEASLGQNTVKMNIAQLESRRAEIRESAVDLVEEHRQLEDQARELKKNYDTLLADVEGLEAKNSQVNRQIEGLQAELEQGRTGREERLKELSSIQLEMANYRQKAAFIQENIGRIREELEGLLQEKETISQGRGGSDLAIQKKLLEIHKMREEIAQAERQMGEFSTQIQEENRLKEEKGRSQKELFEKREAVTERISGLDKDLFRIQSQKEKLEEKLDSQVNYIWNEYGLTYSTAEKLRDPEFTSLSEVKKETEQLKSSIKGLGSVNVNAIEDYKEVSERYEFLKTQHQDLIQAEEALVKIIEELDVGMRRQFEEQFAKIRQEFDAVFKELFGGGRGNLELMEDEDILEAGIQIISQPPGKKLQNMMQLSGGEKALTAIALLFAIQNLKPSPFCLLDEIEAALDDSNVDRFAGYLHKLTENTQFIVITHRRGTMVASDRLYGITMQEKGVSALVSVNLIEAELEQ